MSGCATTGGGASEQSGGHWRGYGGTTAAKYLACSPEGTVDVTLVEPNAAFVLPHSNLVVGGYKTIPTSPRPYDNLSKTPRREAGQRHGHRHRPRQKWSKLASGGELPFDRVIVSPGVDFMYDTLPGRPLPQPKTRCCTPGKPAHRRWPCAKRLEAMPDGGVYALSIPRAPYRCPPGPYERACLVANYFKAAKPKSKVVIFIANDDIQSKKGLFMKAWADHYKGIIEYRPKHNVVDVDAATNTLKFEFNDDFQSQRDCQRHPDMRAGDIAVKTGLATAKQTLVRSGLPQFRSIAVKICMLGDSIQIARHAQVRPHGQPAWQGVLLRWSICCKAKPTIVAHLRQHLLLLVTDEDVVHVASVHRYDAEKNHADRSRFQVACLWRPASWKAATPTPGRNISGPIHWHKQAGPVHTAFHQHPVSVKGQEVSHSSFISRTVIVGLTSLVALGWSASSWAQADEHAPKIASGSCFLCHGAQGESTSEIFPRLAGQNAAYVAKRLLAFQTGARKSTAMADMTIN